MNEEMKSQLADRVLKFMHDNRITCEDTIYQCDWVLENAYEFIGDLFNIIEPVLPSDEEGEENE